MEVTATASLFKWGSNPHSPIMKVRIEYVGDKVDGQSFEQEMKPGNTIAIDDHHASKIPAVKLIVGEDGITLQVRTIPVIVRTNL